MSAAFRMPDRRRLGVREVFACLVAFGVLGLGLELHAPDEWMLADGGDVRFEVGHDQPVSDTHIERVRLVPADACIACALQHSVRVAPAPASVVSLANDRSYEPVPFASLVSSHFAYRPPGRAPPLA